MAGKTRADDLNLGCRLSRSRKGTAFKLYSRNSWLARTRLEPLALAYWGLMWVRCAIAAASVAVRGFATVPGWRKRSVETSEDVVRVTFETGVTHSRPTRGAFNLLFFLRGAAAAIRSGSS